MRATTLRAARKRKNLTQDALAAKSGVSQALISKIENGFGGDHTIGIIRKLESALDLKRGSLIFDSEIAEAS